jgi:hypothetical protein
LFDVLKSPSPPGSKMEYWDRYRNNHWPPLKEDQEKEERKKNKTMLMTISY